MLDKVKLALRLTVDNYDADLTDLIAAAAIDMGIAGIETTDQDAIIERAIITYCKLNFMVLTDGEYDRLKRSYDEQKAQLSMHSAYRG